MLSVVDHRARQAIWVVMLYSLALLLTLGSPAICAEPEGPQPVPVAGHQWGVTGVAVEEGGDQQAAAHLLNDLGIKTSRPTIRWSNIQPLGPDSWNWTGTDALFEAYRGAGIQAWVLIESGAAEWATDTAWLDSDSEPGTDCPPRVLPPLDEPIAGTEPYYLFVRELVARYGDVASAWLIDNEASEPWSWAGDAYSYASMARLAAAAVHDADPSAVAVLGAVPASTAAAMSIADRLDDPSQESFIVSFASRIWGRSMTMAEIRAIFDAPQFRVWDRVNFFRQALAVLPEMDALAGNVLGPRARGELAADIAWAYSDQMRAHGGGRRPLIYTEVNPYLSDDTSLAQQTTQLMLASLATGMVVGQAYHEFIDDSLERVPEPHCGLVTRSLDPKAGYFAYRTLIALLEEAALAGPLSLYQPVTGYWFVREDGIAIYAVWAAESTYVDFTDLLASRSVTVLDMLGAPISAATDNIPVTPSPLYLVLGPAGMADVPFDHWAFDSIQACLDAGFVAGYPDSTYHPEGQVTRDQMAVFISRAVAGGEEHVPPGPLHASFPDVSTDHWAFKYVEYAKAMNVVVGYPPGLYRPDATLDRGQMAVFIARCLAGGDGSVPDGPDSPTFPDVTPTDASSWCYRHVEYIVAAGVAVGYPDGLYHPEHTCSRDQMAAYLARAFHLPI